MRDGACLKEAVILLVSVLVQVSPAFDLSNVQLGLH